MTPPGTAALWAARCYLVLFFIFLAAPLVAACVFAFNKSPFPALPWHGFTLEWFFGAAEPRVGLFHDRRLMGSLATSLTTGVVVALSATLIGLCNAFLFERCRFPLKRALYTLMIVPLVIPGIILGLSLLVAANTVGMLIEEVMGFDLAFLRPGTPLVILGQLSFLITVSTLILGARLGKFDRTQEEAAFNLGAGRVRVFLTLILPFLRPAILSTLIVCFLVSFENFTTTLMLAGSDPPLTITMFDRMAKAGSTPVLNALSLLLVAGCGVLALLSVLVQRPPATKPRAGAFRSAIAALKADRTPRRPVIEPSVASRRERESPRTTC